MATPVDREKLSRTHAEKEDLRRKRAALLTEAGNLRSMIVDLEVERGKKTTEAGRLAYEIYTAELIDDPLICEPHGMECIKEPPSAMSANASIHIKDGATCYSASVGRRSEFTDEELWTYRKIKGRQR